MAGNKNSGRKPSGAERGRAWARMVVNRPSVRKNLEEQAETDANVAIKLFEHGYGRAPQSLKVDTGKQEVVVRHVGRSEPIKGVKLDKELVDATNGA